MKTLESEIKQVSQIWQKKITIKTRRDILSVIEKGCEKIWKFKEKTIYKLRKCLSTWEQYDSEILDELEKSRDLYFDALYRL